MHPPITGAHDGQDNSFERENLGALHLQRDHRQNLCHVNLE